MRKENRGVRRDTYIPEKVSCRQSAADVRGVVRGHVVAALRILREGLADPWTPDSLAEQVHLSRSQLTRAFSAVLGVSPMAYLRQMRVERMAELLSSTDLSIAEAARSVGWADAKYASRSFRVYYGISPSEFRSRQVAPPIR